MPRRTTDVEKIWTVLDIVRWATDFFASKGVDSPRLTIELMLCNVLGVSRLSLYTDHDRPLTNDERARLRGLVQRRADREPLQYILGTANFYGLDFAVNPKVLIPRPETEALADHAIRFLATRSNGYCLDIGTGSGCIPITVCKHVPQSRWLGIDVDHAALDVAHNNAVYHGVEHQVDLQVLNFLEALPMGSFDLVTMNPPYIPAAEVEALDPEVGKHEPVTALTDGADGLSFYRRFAEVATDLIAPGGRAILEIGHGQSDSISEILTDAGLQYVVTKDLAGIPRLVHLERV